MSALDNIIRQRIESLTRYLNDPVILKEKVEELEYFVRRKVES